MDSLPVQGDNRINHVRMGVRFQTLDQRCKIYYVSNMCGLIVVFTGTGCLLRFARVTICDTVPTAHL